MKEYNSAFSKVVTNSGMPISKIAEKKNVTVQAIYYLMANGISNITTAKEYAKILEVNVLNLIN